MYEGKAQIRIPKSAGERLSGIPSRILFPFLPPSEHKDMRRERKKHEKSGEKLRHGKLCPPEEKGVRPQTLDEKPPEFAT